MCASCLLESVALHRVRTMLLTSCNRLVIDVTCTLYIVHGFVGAGHVPTVPTIANHGPCARWNMLLLIHVDACCCRQMQSEHSHLLGFALLGVAACCRLCSSAAMLCGYAVRYGSVWSAVIAHSSRRSTRSFRSRSPRPLLWLQASRSAELVGSRLSPLAAVITMADHHRVTSPITYNSIIL